jgi:hypothetical protein
MRRRSDGKSSPRHGETAHQGARVAGEADEGACIFFARLFLLIEADVLF